MQTAASALLSVHSAFPAVLDEAAHRPFEIWTAWRGWSTEMTILTGCFSAGRSAERAGRVWNCSLAGFSRPLSLHDVTVGIKPASSQFAGITESIWPTSFFP